MIPRKGIVTIVKTTQKAMLVKISLGGLLGVTGEVWIPKSIVEAGDVKSPAGYAPSWWLKTKGWGV